MKTLIIVYRICVSLSARLLDWNPQNTTILHLSLCPKCTATGDETQQRGTATTVKFHLIGSSRSLGLLRGVLLFLSGLLLTDMSPCLHNGETKETEILVSQIDIAKFTFT